MEFRILNAYRDGDMKAHRREAKNTALIECVQVAAEKAKWPIREEFKRDVARARMAAAAARRDPADATRARRRRAPPPSQQRTSYDRRPLRLPPRASRSRRRRAPPPAAAAGAGAWRDARFSSVFGTRRR